MTHSQNVVELPLLQANFVGHPAKLWPARLLPRVAWADPAILRALVVGVHSAAVGGCTRDSLGGARTDLEWTPRGVPVPEDADAWKVTRAWPDVHPERFFAAWEPETRGMFDALAEFLEHPETASASNICAWLHRWYACSLVCVSGCVYRWTPTSVFRPEQLYWAHGTRLGKTVEQFGKKNGDNSGDALQHCLKARAYHLASALTFAMAWQRLGVFEEDALVAALEAFRASPENAVIRPMTDEWLHPIREAFSPSPFYRTLEGTDFPAVIARHMGVSDRVCQAVCTDRQRGWLTVCRMPSRPEHVVRTLGVDAKKPSDWSILHPDWVAFWDACVTKGAIRALEAFKGGMGTDTRAWHGWLAACWSNGLSDALEAWSIGRWEDDACDVRDMLKWVIRELTNGPGGRTAWSPWVDLWLARQSKRRYKWIALTTREVYKHVVMTWPTPTVMTMTVGPASFWEDVMASQGGSWDARADLQARPWKSSRTQTVWDMVKHVGGTDVVQHLERPRVLRLWALDRIWANLDAHTAHQLKTCVLPHVVI